MKHFDRNHHITYEVFIKNGLMGIKIRIDESDGAYFDDDHCSTSHFV